MTTSVIVFFAAIGVVVWFGLTALGTGGDSSDGAARVLVEGGAPQQPAVVAPADPLAANLTVDDGYVVGNFGDPVTDLYADDDDGGWSESALDNAS